MRRPIFAILGFGTVTALIATFALGWIAAPTLSERPVLRFHISLSVAL